MELYLAQELELSQPTVHRHITEMLSADLIREVEVSGGERAWVVERYYAPNFPVVLTSLRRALSPVLEELAEEFVQAFRGRVELLSETVSGAGDDGVRFEDLLHYLYASAARMARDRLEEEGTLPPWPQHPDGSHWVWWAEEPLESDRS